MRRTICGTSLKRWRKIIVWTEIIYGPVTLLLLWCIGASILSIYSHHPRRHFASMTMQFTIGYVIDSVGLVLIFAAMWAELHAKSSPSIAGFVESLRWLTDSGIVLVGLARLDMLRAMTHDDYGEYGWIAALAFNLVLVSGLIALT